MNKETTLQHLIEKAGFYGKLKEIDNKIKMRRYQNIKLFMTYGGEFKIGRCILSFEVRSQNLI